MGAWLLRTAAVFLVLPLAACRVAVDAGRETTIITTTERAAAAPDADPYTPPPITSTTVESEGLPVSSMVFGGVPRAVDPASRFRLFANRAFAAGYSDARLNPLWVAYYLFPVTDPLTYPRPRAFSVDPRSDARTAQECYAYTGFARGQHAPARTIGICYGADAQRETFLMTNVSPRQPRLQQETWRAFEQLEREQYAAAWDVWVITGPVFEAAPEQIACGVHVPNAFYKILVSGRDPEPAMLAIIMAQEDHGREVLGNFTTTVDEVEALTGLDFFPALPDEVEERIESAPPDERWNVEQMLAPDYPK